MSQYVIKCDDVWKVYNQGTPAEVDALRGVDFEVRHGEMIAIVGASGSGKSTLLHIIGALDKPTRGKLSIDGQNVERMNQSQLATLRRKKIGFVFQSFNLINSLTALQNVELPMIFNGVPDKIRKRRATDLLTSVGLEKKLNVKPLKLSGGENQRVAISRALANDPEMILADEPTGNLDSKTGQAIIDIFKKLNKEGKTIVIITHDIHVAREMGSMVTLCDGKIVKHGCKK